MGTKDEDQIYKRLVRIRERPSLIIGDQDVVEILREKIILKKCRKWCNEDYERLFETLESCKGRI